MCKVVSAEEAANALQRGRVVILTFSLSDAQWTNFSCFFRDNKRGVLTRAHLTGEKEGKLTGHAVVITAHDETSWTVKNSWGSEWANEGFCRIGKELTVDLNTKFIDVFFIASELPEEDKNFCNSFF